MKRVVVKNVYAIEWEDTYYGAPDYQYTGVPYNWPSTRSDRAYLVQAELFGQSNYADFGSVMNNYPTMVVIRMDDVL